MDAAHDWQWLGDHLAVDFVNTTIGLADVCRELIATEDDFRAWMTAEPAWLPVVDEAIAMDEIRGLRDAAGRLVRAAALGRPAARDDIDLINAHIRRGDVSRLLAESGQGSRLAAPAGQAALRGVLAAAIVDLLSRDDLASIAVCEAPGCGQVFHRSRSNQRWCSPGCGNRARVDRHRHRNPRANRSGT